MPTGNTIDASHVRGTVSGRTAALLAVLVGLSAFLAPFIGSGHGPGAAVTLVSATLALAVVPGVLATLLVPPRPQLSILEVIGFGIALSFGFLHLVTTVAVSMHAGPPVMLGLIAVLSAVMAARVIQKSSVSIAVTIDECVVCALVILLAVPLYLQGSPFAVYEDQVLAAIVRRLSELPSPRIDNLYVTPGIVYTYPFPSVLYFMGLVARLGDVDPLFVYHKLRFFWGPAALVMLYLTARAVFGYGSVACAAAVTAVVLVCAGIFGMVGSFPAWWAQLVPYTYVPDVTMTVLLPALLVVSFEYVQAATSRERTFFLTAACGLMVTLTVIHIREIIQFAAYVGCFLLVCVFVREFRPFLRRAATLLALTLLVAAVYTVWQSRVANVVGSIVETQRQELVSVASRLPPASLVMSRATDVLADFVQDYDQLFTGLTPFLLFGGVVITVWFRHRPLVWLLASSTMVYLAVMAFPFLAIPYIYVTYFEILHVPVRNVIFFVYLFAGVLAYLAVVGLARMDRTRLSLLVAGGLAGALALLATLGLNQSLRGFSAPLVAAYALAFASLSARPLATRSGARMAATAVVSLLSLAALWPDRVPAPRSEQVTVRWTPGLSDEQRGTLERQFSLGDGEPKPDAEEGSVWNYRLRNLSVENVRQIVTHASVADTHFIDRSTFEVEHQPPPGDDLPWGVARVEWLQYPGIGLFAVTTFFVWVTGFVLPAVLSSAAGTRAATVLHEPLSRPFYQHSIPFVLFIVPFTLWSVRPPLSPLSIPLLPPAGHAATPAALVDQIPCVTTPPMPARFAEEDVTLPERTTCAPDYALVTWLRTEVPVEAVFAVDRWTPYPPQMFMAQQAVVFPTLDASFINEDALFRDYYRFFDARMRRYRVQPFFNAVETPDERDAFVQSLGVTHVLVSPVHYDELRPVLDALPHRFVSKYDHERWAVYEVIREGL
jgi:hypothetical protein